MQAVGNNVEIVANTISDTVGDTSEDTVGDTSEDTVGDTTEDTVGTKDTHGLARLHQFNYQQSHFVSFTKMRQQ